MNMLSMSATLLGGIGMFLLGMSLMTDGLKALAGAHLRDYLASITRRRRDAVLAGATMTILVQSSSATTLATIGFVSAGLLPFETAIGVIVGANIGTTSTGWLVSMLGLKFGISKLALPIIGIGALMRVMGRDRIAHAGGSLAGFGMIFIGIDFLQVGMETLSASIDLAQWTRPGFLGVLILVAVGTVMTVVMQASAAAVATTLTALSAGAITLDQAAALVIGQNLGTTATAVIGAVGASIQAKRTAAIHVLFNVMTGTVAIIALPLFTGLMGRLAPNDPAIAIAAFHTLFNLLGAALFLPIATPAARFVQTHLREKETGIVAHLHSSVSGVPDLAIGAARDALVDCSTRLLWEMSGRLGATPAPGPHNLDEVRQALPRINLFLAELAPQSSSQAVRTQQIDLLRVLDHLGEIVVLLDANRQLNDLQDPAVERLMRHILKLLEATRRSLHDNGRARPGRLKYLKDLIARSRYADNLGSARDVRRLTGLLRTQHQLEQIVYHFWRALRHLEATQDDAADRKQAETMPQGA